jgi:hypothetical protein
MITPKNDKSMNEKSKYWVEIANYDIETAKAMSMSKKYIISIE